jgi:nitrite reductase (NO-forming)
MAGLRAAPATRSPPTQWPRVTLRIAFGIIWLIDAVLKWLPGFLITYKAGLEFGGTGQPGWLQPWFRFWIDLQRHDVTAFAYVVAAAESLIAVALILGFARLLTYTSGLVFSLLLWGVAEGFGGPYGQGSIDVGVAIIYAVMFAALLALDYNQGPGPLTVDGYLRKRLTWWHWIADIGTPLPRADADAHSPSSKPAGTKAQEHPPSAVG